MAAYKASPLPEIEPKTRQRILLGVLTLIVLGAGVALYFKYRSPPQMGADPAVFKTVDALYTAVRAKDVERMAQCEQRLRTAHAEGRLPDAAWDDLTAVIETARAGEWQDATESLYDFMLGQRGEKAS